MKTKREKIWPMVGTKVYINKVTASVSNDLKMLSKDIESGKLKNEKDVVFMVAIRCLGMAIDLFNYSGNKKLSNACQKVMDSI